MGHLYHGYVSHNQRVYIKKLIDINRPTLIFHDMGIIYMGDAMKNIVLA